MIIEYLPSIAALTVIQLLGVMSPGPDFAVVVRNSLIYTRKIGVLTAIGVSLGILVHLTYIFLGLGVVISKTVWLFALFKYLGAAYLMYIGIKGLLAKKQTTNYDGAHSSQEISSFKAINTGFLTNALNPKAMFFFLSLISAFILGKPPIIVAIYGAIIFVSTLLWFVFVAMCFSNARLRSFFKNFQYLIERITGGLLILLAVKMLFFQTQS
jgi:RhtB (resistance to homoserine/threonine) family protein